MTKAVEPTHVKITDVGQEMAGKFVNLQVSRKFEDGYALRYTGDDGKLYVCFINKQGADLFLNNEVKASDEFVLVYKEDRLTEDKKNKYRVFELFFKRGD